MRNKELVNLLKKSPNKELLIKVKGIYMPIEFQGLEGNFVILKLRDDFEEQIKYIKMEEEII